MNGQRSSANGELDFIERLSIEELEALLSYGGDPAEMEALFDAIVKEVIAREGITPTGRLPDVDDAWEEFQAHIGTLRKVPPESLLAEDMNWPGPFADMDWKAVQKENKPRRIAFLRIVRIAATMIATVVLSLALLVGVQAAGTDVFGALARWTDETFHFETRSSNSSSKLYEYIQSELNVRKDLGKYTPKWYPEGTSVIDIEVFEDDVGISAQVSLSTGDGNCFFIGVDQYNQEFYIDPQTFEINASTVEEYISSGRSYFIFENSESVTAVWSDGFTMQSIWGQLDTESIKFMIESIGG